MIAWRNAPLLPFALGDRRHSGKHDCRNAPSDAAGNLRFAGIPLGIEFLDSLARTGIQSEVGCRRPAAVADHVGHVSAQHLALEYSRVQWHLSRLLLVRMGAGERDGKVAS